MGSVDSIDCQEGSRKIPIFQVGRDEQMRLSEGLINSEVSLNQPEELTEEEDHQRNPSNDWGNSDIPTIFPRGGRNLCCRCSNNRSRTAS
jgi:hypothetical protein